MTAFCRWLDDVVVSRLWTAGWLSHKPTAMGLSHTCNITGFPTVRQFLCTQVKFQLKCLLLRLAISWAQLCSLPRSAVSVSTSVQHTTKSFWNTTPQGYGCDFFTCRFITCSSPVWVSGTSSCSKYGRGSIYELEELEACPSLQTGFQ